MDRTFEWNGYIAATKEYGLLGLDFLTEQDYRLPASQGLFLNGTKVHVDVKGLLSCLSRVTAKEDTVIPAESEFVVDITTDIEAFQTDLGIVTSPRKVIVSWWSIL